MEIQRRPRTESTRRPHSQPERLLSVTRNSYQCNGRGKVMHLEDVKDESRQEAKPVEKTFKVFKRRDIGTRAVVSSPEEMSVSGEKCRKTENGISKLKAGAAAGNQKWAPKLKSAEPSTRTRRRPQRLSLQSCSDEDSESPGNRAAEQDSKPKQKLGTQVDCIGLRKSSRVVKKRTFDDEEPEDLRKRRRKGQEDKRINNWADDNLESTDEDRKPKKGSIQEIQASKKSTRQRAAAQSWKDEMLLEEMVSVKERPLTARQRAIQAKEASVQEAQASTSGSRKEESSQQKVESPESNGAVESSKDKAEEAVVDMDSNEKSALTARQKTMTGEGEFNVLEFPEGLNTTDKRRKAKLSEAEKLAKKAEAATKRRQQVEKTAKEIQASAIQKILNQDSSRKKREEKLLKQKQEIAECKKAAESEMATKSVRWVLGPLGTTVSWAQDVELPQIFAVGPISYPPPREKCVACDKAYKYRDSKSNLPLCSLQCYRTIQQPNEFNKAMEVAPAH